MKYIKKRCKCGKNEIKSSNITIIRGKLISISNIL